jgi:asparaginyl-tRNA synthetase
VLVYLFTFEVAIFKKMFRHFFKRNHHSKASTLKDVFVKRALDENVSVRGWIKTVRAMKEFIFCDINDGTCGENLQLVCNKTDKSKLTFGSSIEATGLLSQTPKGQLEVKVDKINLIGECPAENYPFVAKTSYTPEYIRENLHFRSRVSNFNSMIRCRHRLTNIINNYLNNEGFVQIHTPIITSNDCEGAGEVFMLKPDNDDLLKAMRKDKSQKNEEIFFNHKAFLTVSGQLHLEAMSHGLTKVYTFGPTFRAENSKSAIHLSEFYMLELEESFIHSLDDVIAQITNLFKTCTKEFLDASLDDVMRINRTNKDFKVEERFNWIDKEFQVLTFDEAFRVIEKHQDKFKTVVDRREGISKEQEIFLTQFCNGPCYIVDWPKEQKSFYMRQKDDDPNLVEALDFLIPQVGECAGGSVREDNYDRLKAKMSTDESLKWYLDLRKYGSVRTGGFGMGFDRYLQYLLNIHSIKDVIPFPRWAHNCQM